ncbi:MAG: NAD(P)/FAD-dependent oxidoreductase [Candidatus Thorarchaeota archaeon]
MQDLIVIGGGPCGSVCAMHAAKAGLDVTLVDKAKFPRYKSCGGALSNRTLLNLGPKAKKGINCDVNGLTVYSPKWVESTYKEKALVKFVVRKSWDHQVLYDAMDEGTEFLESTSVKDIEKTSHGATVVLSNGESIQTKYVVIADGTGLKSYKKKFGFTQPYNYMARTVCAEVEIDDVLTSENVGLDRLPRICFGVVHRGYGWLFPKKGYINVGIGFANTSTPNENQFHVFDRFVDTLKEKGLLPSALDLSSRKANAIPFSQPFTPIGIDNILLVGDAGGFVSPVTGEGLYYGTTSGMIAASSVSDDLEGISSSDLVGTYTQRWMKEFGSDLIKYGLQLANLVYKSRMRMELIVRMMAKDKATKMWGSRMIVGLADYQTARNRILRRSPLSVLKSVRI